MLPQLPDEVRVAVDEAEVEEDIEVGDVLRLGPAQPGVVGGDPVWQRAAPLGIAGHDPPATIGIAGRRQPLADPGTQAQEIVGDGVGIATVGEPVDQPAVLVGEQLDLATSLASHGDERERRRDGADLRDGQLDQPDGRRVIDRRQRAGDVARASTRGQQVPHQGLGAFAQLGHDLGRLGAADLTQQHQRCVARRANEGIAVHDADDRPRGILHSEVANAALFHA